LRLIQRGDLRPQEMIGSWAGELGQTQMMPSEYYQYAVDYDGDGTRNLLRSAPDVLASPRTIWSGSAGGAASHG
jgi:membrane-bound lytic murein transglycosylase B